MVVKRGIEWYVQIQNATVYGKKTKRNGRGRYTNSVFIIIGVLVYTFRNQNDQNNVLVCIDVEEVLGG